tara:strand:- start:473 stop:631 length:159 start_codon:yes stop_codon:yes gene_type:complete
MPNAIPFPIKPINPRVSSPPRLAFIPKINPIIAPARFTIGILPKTRKSQGIK